MADDKRQTLDIPNGTTFEFKDGKLIFGHESDIVIRTNMGGYKFQKIFSKRGSVQVVPPDGVEFDVDEIEAANGDIFFNGRVKARHARAKTIHFQDGVLAADLLEATEEAVLSGGRVDILHVKAPKVVINAETQGTCLVIESQNDPGRSKARGGFRSPDEALQALTRLQELAGGGARQAARPGAAAPVAAPVAGRAPAPAPAPTAPAPAAAAPAAPAVAARAPAAPSVTEEFRTPFAQPTEASDLDSTSPALPKSSVFRKRS